jgi:hypothetical protein
LLLFEEDDKTGRFSCVLNIFKHGDIVRNSFIIFVALTVVTLQAEPKVAKQINKKVFDVKIAEVKLVNKVALLRAYKDLSRQYRRIYNEKKALKESLNAIDVNEVIAQFRAHNPDALKTADELLKLKRDFLLNNPALDFDQLLFIRRDRRYLGLPANYGGNNQLRRLGNHDEIMLLDFKSPNQKVTSVFKPGRGELITDLELDFDAGKILFSMPAKNNKWQVFELDLQTKALTQMTTGFCEKDDNYDSCYLPNGKIVYTSTAPKVGVPCVRGASHVANNFLLDPTTGKVRQLCFDQEHNWDPTVMNDGKILFQRWDYTDMVHSNNRVLMTMNPDGTNQRSIYGSNSYWPTAFFGPRVLPNSRSKIVGIVTGHHGVHRFGELTIIDTSRGTHEADGAVQRIPGYGKKVEPVGADQLVNRSWPRFTHPYPINDKYFVVTGQLTPGSPIGIYLVDVWDNMLLLKSMPNIALFEPIPVRKRKRPPVIPDRVNLKKKTATVYLQNIYLGPGLEDVPVGTVKKLRVFTYYFANHGQGGLFGSI